MLHYLYVSTFILEGVPTVDYFVLINYFFELSNQDIS
jgi:hypothetical protein